MIVDTSAIVAVLRDEDDSAELEAKLRSATCLKISAATVLELAFVMRASGPGTVDAVVQQLGLRVLDVNDEHVKWARIGMEKYGRGSGSRAKFNLGDCFSYGAAMAVGEPLLFKGHDFVHTDVPQA